MSDVVAAIDCGTNSTRLLVADVTDGAVAELERRTDVTRLGEGVDASGRLADAAMDRVFRTVAGYRERIDRLGTERTVAIATSAVRDSANGDEFRRALRERFGLDARTISGDEEARLTFLGATSRRSDDSGSTLVIDIGGGSTELVVGRPGRPPRFHTSTRAGSVRQTERHLTDDPPSPEQVAAVRDEVRAVVEAAVPPAVRSVDRGIAVAGTATSVAAIDQRLDPYDPARVEGYVLELGACDRILHELAAIPLERRREVPGLHPDRAPTIVAGVAILSEMVQPFGLDAVEVSESDILHGAAISACATRTGYT